MNLNLDWKELNEIDINGQFELFVDLDSVQGFIIKNNGNCFEINTNFPDYNRFEGLCEQMNDGWVDIEKMKTRCLNLFDVSMKQFKFEVLSFIANEFYHLKINEVDISKLTNFIQLSYVFNSKVEKFGDRINWDLFIEKVEKLDFYYKNVIGNNKYDQELRVKEVHFNNQEKILLKRIKTY